jgi:site-specific DNA-methyltransferase (adenine-specific)
MNRMTTVDATLFNADCFDVFASLEDGSVDAVITDPPYFLDQLATDWKTDKGVKVTSASQVTSLPAGMKFDPAQGLAFHAFMLKVGIEAMRVLKPGGFFLSFSAPRLYHRCATGLEDAGLHIRDMWSWLYTQNQVKAMSVARFADMTNMSEQEKAVLSAELAVWKTPQIKSCLEPIVCAQKPPDGTFARNWVEHRTSLVNTSARVGTDGQMMPANVMTTGAIDSALDKAFLLPKPTRTEKGDTSHISVKPLALMDQLIRLTTLPGALVMDPFNGSGSTGISALRLGRNYVGAELSAEYYEQSLKRFTDAFSMEKIVFVEQISSHMVASRASVSLNPLSNQAAA